MTVLSLPCRRLGAHRPPGPGAPAGPGQAAACAAGGGVATRVWAAFRRSEGGTVIASVVRQEGPLGLFRGTAAAFWSYIPFSAVWLGCYERIKRALVPLAAPEAGGAAHITSTARPLRLDPDGEPMLSGWREHFVHAAAGGTSGAIAAVVSNPFDVVKTRIQTAGAPGGANAGGGPAGRTMAAGLALLYRAEGAAGLLRGVVPRAMAILSCR